MEWLISYIQPDLLIISVFLWCLGLFLKKSPLLKSEWRIPFVLLFAGVAMTILYIAFVDRQGFSASVIVTGSIQGVLSAALAVFGNELLKQYSVKRQQDNVK